MKKQFLFFISAFLFTTPLFAAVSPISVGIVNPVMFPPEDFTVTGIRVSALWGQHRNMYGLDIGGLGNITEQTFTGLAVAGIFNSTQGDTTIIGFQAAGLTNMNKNKVHVVGVQVSAVNNNEGASSIVGLSLGIANLTGHTDTYGIQAGIYNKAYHVHGFQIGLINIADSLTGLQIGLVNFHEKGVFKVCPIINFGF